MEAIVEIFGPENLSLLEVAAVFERLTGKAARKQHLPVAMMKVLAAVLGPFHPAFARQVKAGALMAAVPQAVDPTGSPEQWGVPMTRLEDWASKTYR